MRPVLGVDSLPIAGCAATALRRADCANLPRLPAETAGMVGARRGSRGEIILGDVITEIDGERVANNDEFLSAMEKHRVGDTIDIVTTREGEEKRFSVELSEVSSRVSQRGAVANWRDQRLARQLIAAEPRRLPRVHLRLKMREEDWATGYSAQSASRLVSANSAMVRSAKPNTVPRS